MPFESRQKLNPTKKVPQHLAHKPVYALPYEIFDGEYAGDTDAKYLTVGLAQYDSDKVSMKVMRHVTESNRWSRESEETPIHRVIDLSILLAKVLFDPRNGTINIPANTFQNQRSELIIIPEQRTYGEMASYNAYLSENSEQMKARFNKLADVLNTLREEGKI